MKENHKIEFPPIGFTPAEVFEEFLKSFVRTGNRAVAEVIFKEELRRILRGVRGIVKIDDKNGCNMTMIAIRVFGHRANVVVCDTVVKYYEEEEKQGRYKAV